MAELYTVTIEPVELPVTLAECKEFMKITSSYEDDLITERTGKHFTIDEWKKTWMDKLGDRVLFISALNKENLDEFRKRVYDEVREIHVTRFPYNNFLYPEHLDQY